MAGKLRVHQLAKQLDVTSKELLATLKEQGEFVKTASSTIEPPVVKKMRAYYAEKNGTPAEGGNDSAPKPGAKKAAPKPGPAAPKPGGKRPTPMTAQKQAEHAAEAKNPKKPVQRPPRYRRQAAARAEAQRQRQEQAATKKPTPKPGEKRPSPAAMPKPGPRPGGKAPRVANNPFSSGTSERPAPRPGGTRGAQRGGQRRGGQGGPSKGQGQKGGQKRNAPTPAMMPAHPNPGQMPAKSGAKRGGPGGGRGGRRGGTAGAFGRPGGPPRKRRKSKRQKRHEYEAMKAPNVVGGVHLPDGGGKTIRLRQGASLADFAEKIGTDASNLVQALFNLGEMVTATASVSEDTLKLLGDEINYKVQVVSPEDEDRELLESFNLQFGESEGDEDDLETRAPVVSVMGHVDHGKTRLLDAIRHANVAAREAGGITQGIGAYQVSVNPSHSDDEDDERKITFLDTPGHEAFTAMRARGAKSTDIAILVVAADDGVMPQTVEAINHAKAADVPIVVAVNKIDKPEAQPEKIRGQLTEYGLVPEEYGGDTLFVDISARNGDNIDELLEAVLLTADASLELEANPDMDAQGLAIEAHLDRGRGPVATVLVQRGTLRVGDSIVVGDAFGRVRRMLDEYGEDVEEAEPSRPVQVQGLNSVPGAGDNLLVVDDDRVARQIANQRDARRRSAMQAKNRKRVSLEDLDEVLKEHSTLNIILKGDNAGSVEALEDALLGIEIDDEVQLDIIDRGVGAVTQTNVSLAAASDAIIIAFNVRSEGKATEEANQEGVEIRYYTVIYEAIEEVESALKGMLKPVYKESEVGTAEIRQIFKSSAVGLIAGCKVEDGKVVRNAKARLVRDGNVIAGKASIESLRREKDDVTEVSAGYECGMVLSYPDIQVGDEIQVYEMVEVPRD